MSTRQLSQFKLITGDNFNIGSKAHNTLHQITSDKYLTCQYKRYGMSISMGTRLYPCPTHDLMGRVWVLPMGIKLYPYPTHAGTVSAGTRTHG